MVENHETYSEFEKRRILAILGEGRYDLMKMVSVKLYTCGKEFTSWLYSDLEGILCYIIDYQAKVQLLVLYDFTTYEKLFQFELYKYFPNFYTKLTDNFHCFESGNGYFGLKFTDTEEALGFQECVKKFDHNLIAQLFKKALPNRKKDKYKKGKDYVLAIKNKFMKERLTDGFIYKDHMSNEEYENFLKDGVGICKPIYYEMVNNIIYDYDKQMFKLAKIPEDLKNLFKLSGLKKSDFHDKSLALHILKQFAMCYDQMQLQKKEKTRQIYKCEANKIYLKPLEEEEIDVLTRKSFSAFEEFKFSQKNSKIPKVPMAPKLLNTNINTNVEARHSVITTSTDTNSTNDNIDPSFIKLKTLRSANIKNEEEEYVDLKKETNTSETFYDEITKGIQLKKIDHSKIEEKRPVKINKNDANFLANALQQAIKQRRDDLTKNDIESEHSDSDWSD